MRRCANTSGPVPGRRTADGGDRHRRGNRHARHRLVTRLANRGLAMRVLTRDPVRAQHLAGPGVEVAYKLIESAQRRCLPRGSPRRSGIGCVTR